MQGLRSLFCCGSRAQQRAAEPARDDAPAERTALWPHGPPPAPPPAGIELREGLDGSVDDGLGVLFRTRTTQEPVIRPGTPTPPPPSFEDPPVPPGGRWRTIVNCSDAGVQAALRDGISVTLSGGLALLARAAAMMGAAQSSGAAFAVWLGATVGAGGMIAWSWPRAVTLILEPTSLRESVGAQRFVKALPFLALASALAATPNEDDNTKVTIAVLALARQLAAMMRDTFTQTQSGAWGSIEACTADGDGLTHEQTRQFELLRAAFATVVYSTMCWFILNQGADLLAEGLTPITDAMKEKVRAGFPSPGWPLNERGETVDQVLARTSFSFNVLNIASRTILGVVLETFDGYNSGGLAPAVAALSLGLRFKYRQGEGPSALIANWSRGNVAATWQRIVNNTSMRIGLGMGTDIATAVGLRQPAGSSWRERCREAIAILNGLTEPRSWLIQRGVNAEHQERERAYAAAVTAAQAAQDDLDDSARAVPLEMLRRGDRKSGADDTRPPSPREHASTEQAMHDKARQRARSRPTTQQPSVRPEREERIHPVIGLNDSVMTSAITARQRRTDTAAANG